MEGMLDCCKCISFFGILFYVAMGFIIFSQVQFLRFKPENKMQSVGACFITALIELLIVVGITLYQKASVKGPEIRQNYIDFKSERSIRQKQNSFKEIPLGDLKVIRSENRSFKMIQEPLKE